MVGRFLFSKHNAWRRAAKNLVSACIPSDVIYTFATRLIAMLIGGTILTLESNDSLYALLGITHAIAGVVLRLPHIFVLAILGFNCPILANVGFCGKIAFKLIQCA